jgi:hypothetical protein
MKFCDAIANSYVQGARPIPFLLLHIYFYQAVFRPLILFMSYLGYSVQSLGGSIEAQAS